MISFASFYKLICENAETISLLHKIPSSKLGLSNSMQDLPEFKPYGFWINPHGNFVTVLGSSSHVDEAKKIVARANELLPRTHQINIPIREVDAYYKFLYTAGYVRVICAPDTVYGENGEGKPATNGQKKTL